MATLRTNYNDDYDDGDNSRNNYLNDNYGDCNDDDAGPHW